MNFTKNNIKCEVEQHAYGATIIFKQDFISDKEFKSLKGALKFLEKHGYKKEEKQ